MGTVLSFKTEGHARQADEPRPNGACEIVIFPGVRIERQRDSVDPDLSGTPGSGKLDGTNGRRRTRKTS